MRALVVALMLAAASTAFADDGDERKARAARLVDEASAAEKRADYATAIARLREAYDLIPHPALLYNLGQAHRLAGQPWDALEQYERYLAVEPKGPFAAKARGFVAALKKETAGKPRPVERAPSPDPTPIDPGPAVPVKPRVEDPPPILTLPTPRGRSAPGWRRPVAIGLGVAGVAGLGGGIF
jgi:tetratricopeptide (TPR) repeat protein